MIKFGTAGIPITTPNHNTVNGVAYVRKLGLDVMELEFVRSINITKQKAPEVRATAKKNNIILTCHAPYYVNLAAKVAKKLKDSMNRVLNSARIAYVCGARDIVFHAGYYMERPPEIVHKIILKNLQDISKKLHSEGVKVCLRPEISGKNSVYGSLDELIKLSQEVPRTLPCIDFSHLYARTVGDYNTQEKFEEILEKTESKLGKHAIKNMHIHFSGITYGPKGEKKHTTLKQCRFNYRALARALKNFHCAGTAVCESSNIEKDALLMQKVYRRY